MIRILTNLPKQLITSDYRYHIAKSLSRFLPNGGRPFPINDTDGAYVFDDHNDWWCVVDDENSQIVSVTYRDTFVNHKKERAFAEWVCANRLGWTIIPGAEPTGTAVTVDVALDVKLPYKTDEWELGSISFEIPIEAIQVYLDMKRVPGAAVTGYTTSDSMEVVS